jgi:hypothetical protein
MKNIHILPTDKPSRFYSTARTLTKKRGYAFGEHYIPNTRNMFSNHNIYITSDEEIKRYREYYLDIDTNEVKTSFENMGIYLSNEKKIVLTTDQDLIKDGVEPIPDDFLEWFVKNPSCEEVEIINTFDYIKKGYVSHSGYKIQITKEEAKQGTMSEAIKKVINDKLQEEPKQETLEEIVNKLSIKEAKDLDLFLKGIEWQKEQNKNKYSDGEVLPLLEILEKCKEYFLLKTDAKSEERADAICQAIEDFNKIKNK